MGLPVGLIVYEVYDLTNMVTLENWPVRMVWGMTDNRAYRNLTGNRHAAFLFKTRASVSVAFVRHWS